MSGIAELLLNLGYRVSGSDLKESEITRRLASLGGIVSAGHRAENVAPGDLALLEVGSAHPVAEVQQELGDAAHADSPDPDEVDLDLLVAEHCAPLQVTYCECTRFDLR